MSDKVVFKTTDPEALQAWENLQADHHAWRERFSNVKTKVGINDWLVSTGLGRETVLGPSKHEIDDDPPAGWRMLKTFDYLKPERGKRGEEARELLESIRHIPYAEDLAEKVGVPSIAFAGLRIISPGFIRHGDTLYLTWAKDPGEHFAPGERWEPCPLSEYYAAKEAHEAEQAGAS